MRSRLLAVLPFAQLLFATPAAADSPFPVTNQTPPANWTGPVFVPSFAFPATFTEQELPWAEIDFRTKEGAATYMKAVKAYVFDGMDTETWDVAKNPIRKWYHVPWMHTGTKGREFIHGLTKERSSRVGELGPAQTRCRQNWAVGFYNPAGGTVLHQIWGDGSAPPKLESVQFPIGTVVAKLLFTEADSSDNPILQGAPEWQANIYTGHAAGSDGCLREDASLNPFSPRPLRLLQFDIAVRDANADPTTGWVFGTFVYNGKSTEANPWDRLHPIGLMWGNDPELADGQTPLPQESIVLDKFGFDRDFGRNGRMNGPVDNVASACLSCHMTAQYPSTPLTPRSNATWDNAKCWFRNLGPDDPFGSAPPNCGEVADDVLSFDFSLQMSGAIANYILAHPDMFLLDGSKALGADQLLYPVSREGF